MCKGKKLLVGGYFDDRKFKGDYFDGKTPFNKDINTYTVDEALNLGFVENVINWYEDSKEKSWDQLPETEKAQQIEEYTSTDEIAGLNYFTTEEEATQYKNEVLEELQEIETEIEYQGMEQNNEGIYQEIYTLKQ